MGGLSSVSSRAEVGAGIVQGTGMAVGGIAATKRGNSGRQAVPRHADRSQVVGLQQSHGISWSALDGASSAQGMSSIAAAMADAAAAWSASSAAWAGTTSVVVIIEMTTSQCKARRVKRRMSRLYRRASNLTPHASAEGSVQG
jgi:hypothetical protein